MKLLLTSAGLTNSAIVNALHNLLGKPFLQASVAFIPTAANGEEGDKWWLVEDMQRVQKLGWKRFDIVDFSAIERSIWQRRLQECDVLVFGGGSTYHLMQSIEKSGFREVFERMLQQKIYVGISAGSMIVSRKVQFGWDQEFYGIQTPQKSGVGLGLVDFYIMPHFEVKDFSKVTKEHIAEIAQYVREPIYLLDNNTAIVIDGEELSIVGEGKWEKFN